jgi:hypothetical protein
MIVGSARFKGLRMIGAAGQVQLSGRLSNKFELIGVVSIARAVPATQLCALTSLCLNKSGPGANHSDLGSRDHVPPSIVAEDGT